MRFTGPAVLAVLLIPGASVAVPPASKPVPVKQVEQKMCDMRGPRMATSGEVRVFRDPRAFPPSDLHHAVDRRVGNCPVPAIVRRNVGR